MNASVAFAADDKAEGKAAGAADAPARTVVIVPASALRDGSVFVLLDGKALRRAVKTGATSPQGVRVEQGLIGGEDLIANPPPGLKDGDAVRRKAATL
jgi:HlyD family secretion protein